MRTVLLAGMAEAQLSHKVFGSMMKIGRRI
jgi:hypothetical protein